MRNTYRSIGRAKGPASAAVVSDGASTPSPIGGWDAISPISAMPPQNAVDLVNWFPQPGYVELRRGFVFHCDTGSGEAVESIIPFQGQDPADESLLAASDGTIYNVTVEPAVSVQSGFANNRWQYVNFTTSGGSFAWMCNGEDMPQYWDGSSLAAVTITGINAPDIINVVTYRSRLWFVMRDSNIAAYLPVDSIQGAAVEFPLETYFVNGGKLVSIGTWSTDTNEGPNEFIVFVSSYGDIALFQIEDPDDPTKIFYRGTTTVGSPIGTRCMCKVGSDLALITIDGVLPVSQVLNYDRGALLRTSLTKNIRAAMTDAAQRYKNNFGWQMVSYPRNTMAILNVPVAEGGLQDQFVMNTITGAWCKFVGQNANTWAIWRDRAYFGNNDGVVCLADEAGGDEDQTLSADMRCAFNYYGQRGREKRWTMARPSITIDVSFPVLPEMGLNTNFSTSAPLYPITFGNGDPLPLWNEAIWGPDAAAGIWPGETNESGWATVEGMGYCASIRFAVDIPWSEDVRVPRSLKVNSFDVLLSTGAYI